MKDTIRSQSSTAPYISQDKNLHSEMAPLNASSSFRSSSDGNFGDTDRIAQHFTDVIGHDEKFSESMLELIPSPAILEPFPNIKQSSSATHNPDKGDSSSSRFTCINESHSEVYECVITKKNGCIGLTLACVDDHVQIKAVSDGTPAAHCGLRVGDTVVAVSGISVSDLQFSTIIGYLKSNARKSVVLKLRRNPFQSSSPKPNAKRLRNGCVKEFESQPPNTGEPVESGKNVGEGQLNRQNEERYVKLCQKVCKNLRQIRTQREWMESSVRFQIEDATVNERQPPLEASLIRDSRHAVWEQERLILDIVTRMTNQIQNILLFGNRMYEEIFYGVRYCALDLLFPQKYRKDVQEDKVTQVAAIYSELSRENEWNDLRKQSDVFRVESDACTNLLERELSDHILIPNEKEELSDCKASLSDEGLICIYDRLEEVLHLFCEFQLTKS
uniref:Uncharacterized protein AlNc14C101G6040 n=1 Tax=Albugo laibachii Nc14 TaxID=890382 RepID=F0WHH7_9STRA|nr:conserved hypothetical protein [Albugo laibachii Nc14]|eukprot:CCA20696.1 conserved hypothetical protein [Albugo laibachii Nc14]